MIIKPDCQQEITALDIFIYVMRLIMLTFTQFEFSRNNTTHYFEISINIYLSRAIRYGPTLNFFYIEGIEKHKR